MLRHKTLLNSATTIQGTFRDTFRGMRLGTRLGTALVATLVASLANAQQITQTHEYVPGEVIVKLKSKSKSLQASAFIGKAVSEKSMTLKGTWNAINMHQFALKPGASVEDSIRDLQNDPEVEYAEPNYIVKSESTGVEGEPVSMGEVYSSAATGSTTYAQTTAPIQVQNAWQAMSNTSETPIVAVIDTGIDANHEVFTKTGAVWTNTRETLNGLDDDGNGYIDDIHGWNFVANSNDPNDDDGHGTHVSGIILGVTENILASNPDPAKIRIMPLKFLDNQGSGTTSDAIKAIYYAVNNGAKVLNNSWGGGGYSNSLIDAMSYAYDHKVLFVAAAGNAASNNDSAPTYPANYAVPNVISVAATTDSDGFASYSNYGKTTVHMGSPGSYIYSTLPSTVNSSTGVRTSSYGRASGTSMATPFVSGLAALMVREAPSMSGYQVRNLILNGLNSVSSLSNRTTTQGRLNVYNSVLNSKSASIDGSQPAFSASAIRMPSSEVSGSAGGCGLVKKMVLDGEGGDDGGSLTGAQKNLAFFGLLAMLAAPVLLSVMLRQRSTGKELRRHTRYQIDSSVRVRFGDRELVGQVSTISLGGLQLNTEELLEKGGLVKMSIQSPDGSGTVIEVEGRVVWSEEQKRYGVAFAGADESALGTINRWTQSLLKA